MDEYKVVNQIWIIIRLLSFLREIEWFESLMKLLVAKMNRSLWLMNHSFSMGNHDLIHQSWLFIHTLAKLLADTWSMVQSLYSEQNDRKKKQRRNWRLIDLSATPQVKMNHNLWIMIHESWIMIHQIWLNIQTPAHLWSMVQLMSWALWHFFWTLY